MKDLVIVESPSKSKTISKYLGDKYEVVSSKGHIRDLTTSGKFGFGVNVEEGFIPEYKTITGKGKIVTELKKLAKNSNKVYIASDPDREGEAIAWHIKDVLKLTDENYDRVVFNEITKDKVNEAFDHPRKIDDLMVKSQETRRILDRIIGFRLSKLMQSKTGGKSAGRVQSVALKLIVDREREIEAFNPEQYFTVSAIFNEFEADLFSYNSKKIEIKTETEKDKILDSLSKSFKIEDIKKETKSRKAKAPYITSTLQQDGSNKLNFSGKKTMSVAQKLYEGMNIGTETTGLITYMRTDSIRLSDEFTNNAFGYITKEYSSDYIGHTKTSKKTENVQDAHEAIRPTNINNTPEKIKDYLSEDEYKLYRMIYYRALASLMKDAKFNQTSIILDNNNYGFKATGSVLLFDGYLKVYKDYEDTNDVIMPDLESYKTNVIISKEIEAKEHFTKPKPRYTEAKLIKELEEQGIGRPSTYVKIIDTLKLRNYVTLEAKKFSPTEIGTKITDRLQEFFSYIINVEYTKGMEDSLDDIAEGKSIWNEVLDKFYKEFSPVVEKAFDEMVKEEPEETGEMCPQCGSPLVKRKGRYGEFVACSNFPECKYIKQDKKEEQKHIIPCPKCDGFIVEKKTRRGKVFYGCNNYPKCDTAYWDMPLEDKCPKCGGVLVQTKDKIKCTACDYEK